MTRKLKIAIYTEGFFTGGTERQVIELIKGLDRNRFVVYALCSRSGGGMAQDLEDAGVKIEYFPLQNLRDANAVRQLVRLRRFLIENEIDILHTFSLTGNTFAVIAGLLARVPLIITSRRDMGVMIRPIYWPLQIACSFFADAISVNAAAIKQMLIKKERVSADKISVIYNGIDLSRFSIDRSCGLEARRELQLAPETPVIGMVAQIKPIKGHRYLLEAAQQVARIRPDLRVLIIGDGAERPQLENYTAELGIKEQVRFLGQQSEQVTRLLAAMDISLLSSLSEGVSNSLLESMAMGTPVIATNVGGNPEIVINEQTGLLVPPADSAAMGAAILRLLDDPVLAARLAENARKMVFNNFGNEKMVGNFGDFYFNLLESRINHTGRAARAGLRRRIVSA